MGRYFGPKAKESLFFENLESITYEFDNLKVTFQQDAATAHYSALIGRYLDE